MDNVQASDIIVAVVVILCSILGVYGLPPVFGVIVAALLVAAAYTWQYRDKGLSLLYFAGIVLVVVLFYQLVHDKA